MAEIIPEKFKIDLDDSENGNGVPDLILTLHGPGNFVKALRLSHPECLAHRLGVALIGYTVAQRRNHADQELPLLVEILSDLRDVVDDLLNETQKTSFPHARRPRPTVDSPHDLCG